VWSKYNTKLVSLKISTDELHEFTYQKENPLDKQSMIAILLLTSTSLKVEKIVVFPLLALTSCFDINKNSDRTFSKSELAKRLYQISGRKKKSMNHTCNLQQTSLPPQRRIYRKFKARRVSGVQRWETAPGIPRREHPLNEVTKTTFSSPAQVYFARIREINLTRDAGVRSRWAFQQLSFLWSFQKHSQNLHTVFNRL